VDDVLETVVPVVETVTPVVDDVLQTVVPVVDDVLEPVVPVVDDVVQTVVPVVDDVLEPVVPVVDDVVKPVMSVVTPVLDDAVETVVPVVDDVVRTVDPVTPVTAPSTASPGPFAVNPPTAASTTPRAGVRELIPGTATTPSKPARPLGAAPATRAPHAVPGSYAGLGLTTAFPNQTSLLRPPAGLLEGPASDAGRRGSASPVAAPVAPPALSGGSAGGTGGSVPPPPGAVGLGVAALALLLAGCFSRLLCAPARWRPVFFVSLIERPG
jgi:hypothetical protein